MGAPGVKPKEDRSQVRHANRVHEFTEVEDVPFESGPDLPIRGTGDNQAAWTAAGVIPGTGWPEATLAWWNVIRRMPHCTLWAEADWSFAIATAETHARFIEGWKGYTGGELRQREKLMGVFLDARRDLRIKYVPAKAKRPADELPSEVARLDDYRAL